MRELGSLDRDEYDQIQEVMDWLLNVIKFNLFSMQPMTAGIAQNSPQRTNHSSANMNSILCS